MSLDALIQGGETRKVDFKRDQYRLENETLKSEFVKDILCMANAPGDGCIVLGVRSEKGKPKEVVGITNHHDSADLAALVNSIIEAPVQFEYHAVRHKGKDCDLHVKKGDIETVFGDGLSWQRLDTKRACRIAKYYEDGGYRDDEDRWPELQSRLINAMISFHRAISPHLKL